MTNKAVLHCLSVLVTASFVVDTRITTVRLIMIVTTDSLFQLGSVSVCSQQMECRVDTPNIVFAKQKNPKKLLK